MFERQRNAVQKNLKNSKKINKFLGTNIYVYAYDKSVGVVSISKAQLSNQMKCRLRNGSTNPTEYRGTAQLKMRSADKNECVCVVYVKLM